jgi:hypothetical protein
MPKENEHINKNKKMFAISLVKLEENSFSQKQIDYLTKK